ncbi:DUF1385 domain-containing protein [Natranaerofaba carboxydovora]|uniref:DUF1385 domain-containing protein n=1 Tax=Natranaerofaba carboxydovora TaxID=2742683 RepID=UPI001F138D22|nr:DUF1385 domain-containing protein [Natranaerofaba carboxydovora]UMZ74656.1 hypothetical protein ACONDI_02255 [Natranaerofaba carboxydovora]
MNVEDMNLQNISIKDKILGGRAKFNGIYFFASDCIVIYNDFSDGFKLTKKRSNLKQNKGILTKIPIVRSFMKLKMLVKLLSMTLGKIPKLFLLLVLILSVFSDILFLIFPGYFIAASSSPSFVSSWYFMYLVLIVLVGLLVTGKLKLYTGKLIDLFRYHGAEHKAINAALMDEPLTVNNIKKQSRVSSRCGTTLVVFYLPLVFLLNYLTGTVMFINVLISLILAMELFNLVKIRFFEVVFKPLLWVSALFQYLIMTKEPTDKQLEAAARAVRLIGEGPGAPLEERIFYTNIR